MERLTDIEKYNELLCRIPLFCDLPHNVKSTLLGGACQAFRVNKKEEVATGDACPTTICLVAGEIKSRYH